MNAGDLTLDTKLFDLNGLPVTLGMAGSVLLAGFLLVLLFLAISLWRAGNNASAS